MRYLPTMYYRPRLSIARYRQRLIIAMLSTLYSLDNYRSLSIEGTYTYPRQLRYLYSLTRYSRDNTTIWKMKWQKQNVRDKLIETSTNFISFIFDDFHLFERLIFHYKRARSPNQCMCNEKRLGRFYIFTCIYICIIYVL